MTLGQKLFGISNGFAMESSRGHTPHAHGPFRRLSFCRSCRRVRFSTKTHQGSCAKVLDFRRRLTIFICELLHPSSTMALRLINRPLLAGLSPVALQVAKANAPAVSVAFSRLYPAARSLSKVAKVEDEPAGHAAYKDPFAHPFFTKGFDEFFSTPFFKNRDSPLDLMPIFPALPRGTASMLRVSSPGFEIHEDDDKYSISIDVPGVRAEDMEIRLENDGRVLHLSGGRMIDDGDEVRETRFDKRFSIGEAVDTDNIKANLDKGVLTVMAPKEVVAEKEFPKIAITEGPME